MWIKLFSSTGLCGCQRPTSGVDPQTLSTLADKGSFPGAWVYLLGCTGWSMSPKNLSFSSSPVLGLQAFATTDNLLNILGTEHRSYIHAMSTLHTEISLQTQFIIHYVSGLHCLCDMALRSLGLESLLGQNLISTACLILVEQATELCGSSGTVPPERKTGKVEQIREPWQFS